MPRSWNQLVTGIGRASDGFLLRELFQPELEDLSPKSVRQKHRAVLVSGSPFREP